MAGVAQISQETKERVLAATDIVELIGSYIEVKRGGAAFKALCPFHNEKSPSFNINAARQFFHCFGCGKSGDAITFVREYENLPFNDAVKKLALRAGIPVVEEAPDPKEDRARRQRGRLLDINREAAAFMHRLLMRSQEEARHAREYLKSRGFGAEMATRWSVGWAPGRTEVFRQWAQEKGYSGRELLDAGLLRQGDRGAYPLFRDRLMFPIRDDRGEVVGFSGRQLRDDQGGGKYVNTPETALFKKSQILFALDRARRAILTDKTVIICEGQIDVIACHESGVENVIACQGSSFTPQHAQMLRRYSAKTAILCFDSDGAGFKGATGAFRQLAPEGVSIRMAQMPAGEDPDSFLRKHGAEAFRKLLGQAPDFFTAMTDRAQREGRMESPETRAQLQQEYAPLLALVADPVMQDALINQVSTRLKGSSSSALRSSMARSAREEVRRAAMARARQDAGQTMSEPQAAPEPEEAALDSTVRYLCGLALSSPEAQDWLGEQYETLHEAGEYLEGMPLLEAILAARPDPASPAAVNAFLSTLEEPQQRALYADDTFHRSPPEDPRGVAEVTLAQLSAKALMYRDARVRSELGRPDLSVEEMAALMTEAKQLQELLQGVKARFVNDEAFITDPGRRRPAQGWRGDSKKSFGKRERNS